MGLDNCNKALCANLVLSSTNDFALSIVQGYVDSLVISQCNACALHNFCKYSIWVVLVSSKLSLSLANGVQLLTFHGALL